MKESKIITAESEYGETDLYDGMIMSAFEDIFYLNNLDRDILQMIYKRVSHYVYVLEYIEDPVNHPVECLEAHALKEKFGDFNPGLLVMVLARLEVMLGL